MSQKYLSILDLYFQLKEEETIEYILKLLFLEDLLWIEG